MGRKCTMGKNDKTDKEITRKEEINKETRRKGEN